MNLPKNSTSRLFPGRRGRLLVVAFALAGAVVLVEIALRTYAWVEASRRNDLAGVPYTLSLYATDGLTSLSEHEGRLKLILDPFVTYRNLPNQHDPWFTINSQGYRGEELDRNRQTTRIVLVGGSAAFGTGARSDQDTLAAALERRFEDVRVINAAVNGHVSTDELTLLEKELLDLDPSLVLALDGFNDSQLGYVLNGEWAMTNSTFRDLENRLIDWRATRTNPAWAGWAFLRSCFRELGGRVEKLRRLPNRIRQDWYGEMPADHLEAKLQIYTRNVRRMASLAAKRDVGFLVMIQPQRPNVWRHWEFYSGRYNLFVQKAAHAFEKEGIGVLDLHAAKQIGKEHFLDGDDIHFNAAGVEVVADIVAEHIQSRGLLDQPQAQHSSDGMSPLRQSKADR